MTGGWQWRWLWLWFTLLLFGGSAARADDLRPGYLELAQVGAQDWTVTLSLPIGARAQPALVPIVPAACVAVSPTETKAEARAVVTSQRLVCRGEISGMMIGVAGWDARQSEVFARVIPRGGPAQSFRLTAAAPRQRIASEASWLAVARAYLVTGAEHIIFGYDHLLFVVALVLLLGRMRAIAEAVTAFTIAHSVTLIATTLGFVAVSQTMVESLIALSIVSLAVELAKRGTNGPGWSERWPWLVAFGFGLLHGFGFASALADIGLPRGAIVPALLMFNLGVELGQLLVVTLTLALIAAVGRWAAPARPAVITASAYAIGITASAWFIERTIG